MSVEKTFKRMLAFLCAAVLVIPMLLSGHAMKADAAEKYPSEPAVCEPGRDMETKDAGTIYVSEGKEEPEKQAARAAVTTANITWTGQIGYFGWFTRDFKASDENGTFNAWCFEPSLSPAEGEHQVVTLNDNRIKAAIYTSKYGYEYDSFWDHVHVDDTTLYGIVHALCSFYYTGNTDGFNDEGSGSAYDTIFRGIPQCIDDWLSNPANEKKLDNYNLYIAKGNGTQDIGWLEPVPTGYLALTKESASPDITAGNGCYSLAGARYGVYTDIGCTNQKAVLITNEQGKTNTVELDNGSYYVKELSPSTGYELDNTVYSVTVSGGQTTTVTNRGNLKETPGNDPAVIDLIKIDKETGTQASLGDAPGLEGAEFTVKYYDGYYDTVEDLPEDATRTWVIKSKETVNPETGNRKYLASLDDDYLVAGSDETYKIDGITTIPLGTITVEETKAPEGYTLDKSYLVSTEEGAEKVEGIYIAQIVEEETGRLFKLQGGNEYEFANQIKRGDFEFTKKDEDSRNLANVKFKITSKTTGESHEITTDANGFYSSSADVVPHTQDTNGGTAESGLWFGQYVDENGEKKITKADDTLGALPHDEYIVEELRCDANKGKELVKFTLKVTRDGFTVDMGTLTDLDISIFTTASNEETGTHYAFAGGDTVANDKVQYTGLKAGETYELETFVMDKASEQKLLDADGNPVTVKKEFTAKAKNSSVDTEVTFDASGLAGKDIVFFEYLYQDGELKASHEDIDDEDQTIHFAAVSTKARDADTGTNLALAGKEMETIDEITFSNLEPGKKHKITGVLMDKEIGKEALDDHGEIITAEAEYTPEESSGTAEIHFTYSGESLAGSTLVVFEEVSRDGKVLAEHKDIEAEAQTIYIPKIGTTALDTASLTHNALASSEAVIRDRIAYENLPNGAVCRLEGIQMVKETGEVLEIDGEPVTASVEFIAREGEAEVLGQDPDMEEETRKLVLTDQFVLVKEAGDEIPAGTYVKTEEGMYLSIDALDGEPVEIPEDYMEVLDEAPEGFYDYGEADTLTLYILGGAVYTEEEYQKRYAGEMDSVTGDEPEDGSKAENEEEAKADGAEDKTDSIDGTEDEAGEKEEPKTVSGTVDVYFLIDASGLKGKTLTAFEELYIGDKLAAEHKDLEDEGQSVSFPELETRAVDKADGNKTLAVGGKVTVLDQMPSHGLILGMTYETEGILMDKASGEPFLADGKEVTASVTFTADSTDGTAEAEFTFEADESLDGTELVVFEKLYIVNEELESGKELIAVHEDINSESQTVRLIKEPKIVTAVQTGLHKYGVYFAVGAIVLAVGSAASFRRRWKEQGRTRNGKI